MTALRDVSVTFHRLSGAVQALRDVTLTLPEEGIVGLLGRNGAGKSTLMRVLSGNELRHTGTVDVARPVMYAGDRWPHAYDQTLQSLMGHLARVHPAFDAVRAAELLAMFKVDPRQFSLSRGQVSAGLVSLALASRAPVTLLDEPTLGMDAPSRALLARAIVEEQAEQPRCIVLSTHLIDESADLFERVLVLHHGRLRVDADAEELLSVHVRVEGAAADIEALPTVGPIERLGNHATAIVRRDDAPAHLRTRPVRLQELATVLTEGALP
ncbi:MAG: ABC transporter ATP-binding protein [Propionibacteriaceae bacterium]|nr:ABC transporter ATP-binding protein [Propionibacteriaceae bacterium]